MEQHAVPQNISSYQFHLVGDMTLKQFLELGSGVLIAVIIYATGLPGIIKVPLMLFSAGLGAALAFVPFEERPLEQWIFAFFRSIYSPTLFHWEQQSNIKYFQDEKVEAGAPTTTQTKINPFSKVPFLNKLEDSESSYLTKITNLFIPVPSPSQQSSQTNSVVNTNANTTQQIARPQVIQQPSMQARTTYIQPQVEGNILTAHTNADPISPMTATGDQRPTNIQIPHATYITLNNQGQPQNNRPQMVVEEITNPTVPVNNNVQTNAVPQTMATQNVAQSTQATFSVDAAPPSLPTIVNTVSGQVLDRNRRIIEGVIMEIVDESGRSVRALKSNKAGHFLIVTALTNGKYKIIAEKEGYDFEPISFEAKGDIIQPIAIQAR